MEFSILVENFHAFLNLARTLRHISYEALVSLKENGIAFFEDSEYWLKRPTVLLKKYYDDKGKEELWEELQRKINQNFNSFAEEARKKVEYIYAFWPLTKDSESLKLAGYPSKSSPKHEQSYWIQKWLRDLDNWSKKRNHDAVHRYLLVSGQWENNKYRLAVGNYKKLLKDILKKHFLTCNYRDNVYVILDDNNVLVNIFGSGLDRSDIVANTILFACDIVTDEIIRGYLQFEEIIPIKNNRNLLNFRYLNLREKHKKVGRYLGIFRSLARAIDDNRRMAEGGEPCVIRLQDFWDRYIKNK